MSDWRTVKPKYALGQKVRLSERGMESIAGLRSWDQVEQAKSMVLTRIDPGSLCTDKPVHYIEVDQPDINKFVLTTEDVEAL